LEVGRRAAPPHRLLGARRRLGDQPQRLQTGLVRAQRAGGLGLRLDRAEQVVDAVQELLDRRGRHARMLPASAAVVDAALSRAATPAGAPPRGRRQGWWRCRGHPVCHGRPRSIMSHHQRWLLLPPAVAMLIVLGPLAMSSSSAADAAPRTPPAKVVTETPPARPP